VAYLAALDRIAAANREPTPQKAGCLFSALGAMASDDERAAEQWIARCQHADSQSTMKCSCIPSPCPAARRSPTCSRIHGDGERVRTARVIFGQVGGRTSRGNGPLCCSAPAAIVATTFARGMMPIRRLPFLVSRFKRSSMARSFPVGGPA
jgi:hypothetical protein